MTHLEDMCCPGKKCKKTLPAVSVMGANGHHSTVREGSQHRKKLIHHPKYI